MQVISSRRTSLLALLAFLFSVAALAEEPASDGWILDQNGCKHANPSPQPNERLTWSGSCKDGVGEGNGVIEWYVGDKLVERYEGGYKAGKPDGNGVLISTQQGYYRYDGGWIAGSPSGIGRMELPDGSVYNGEFKDWKFNGRGELITPDGTSVYGNWRDGELVEPLEKL